MSYPIPDKTEKTTKIPARLKDGKLVFIYNENLDILPLIENNSVVELTVSTFRVKNNNYLKHFDKERTVLLLPRSERVIIRMAIPFTKEVDPAKMEKIETFSEHVRRISPTIFIGHSYFAEIELYEDLRLKYRGTKFPQLIPCVCRIPILGIEAMSLNHAYSLLSQTFQLHRIAHTGNVFTNAFYLDHSRRRYIELNVLRDDMENKENQLNFKFDEDDQETLLFEAKND